MTRQIGDQVKVSEDNDNECYNDFRDTILIITKIATMSMPANEYNENGQPEGYHPGYDEGMNEMELYDFETEDGEAIRSSLYEYEIEGT